MSLTPFIILLLAGQETELPKKTPTQADKLEEIKNEQPPEEEPAVVSEPEKEEKKDEAAEPAKDKGEEAGPEVKQTPVQNNDVVTLTSEKVLNSKALVPNSGFSVSDEYFDDVAFVGDSITEETTHKRIIRRYSAKSHPTNCWVPMWACVPATFC